MSECRLIDPEKTMILPHDPGEPPSWGPSWAFPYADTVWLERPEFDELLKRKDQQPCDICPKEVKEKCHQHNPPTPSFDK